MISRGNIVIVLLIVLCLLAANKTSAQGSTKNIRKIIGENTPEFIVKPLISAFTSIEKFRSDSAIKGEDKRGDVGKELEDPKISRSFKIWKITELFFFAFLSTVLNNKLIFYGSLVLIVFLILRHIWYLIF